MKKTMILGLCSLLLLAMGAEAAEDAMAAQRPVLQASQLIAGAKKDEKKVVISGQVKEPGKISWTKGLTLKQALAEVGGLSQLANRRRVEVLRKGKKMVFDLNNLKKDPPILAGDQIFVRERIF